MYDHSNKKVGEVRMKCSFEAGQEVRESVHVKAKKSIKSQFRSALKLTRLKSLLKVNAPNVPESKSAAKGKKMSMRNNLIAGVAPSSSNNADVQKLKKQVAETKKVTQQLNAEKQGREKERKEKEDLKKKLLDQEQKTAKRKPTTTSCVCVYSESRLEIKNSQTPPPTFQYLHHFLYFLNISHYKQWKKNCRRLLLLLLDHRHPRLRRRERWQDPVPKNCKWNGRKVCKWKTRCQE